MKSVAPARGQGEERARGRRRSSVEAEMGAARSSAPRGRGRSVGSVEQRRRAGELLAPVGELRLQRPPLASQRRCQTAKSAYCTGSSGSGEGSPAAKAG